MTENQDISLVKNSGVSISQLRYFVAVAETGQIQAAARSVNISASAVTDSIKALESTLNEQLVVRHHKGMALTTKGRLFLTHAKAILNQLNEALSSLDYPTNQIKGTLQIATTASVLGYFLPRYLGRFKATYPQIELKLQEKTRPAVEKSILNGQADIGVAITSNLSQVGKLNTLTLTQSSRSIWCAANHPFANLDEVSLESIKDHPYIQLKLDEADRNTREFWDTHGITPKTSIETTSVEAVRSLVAANLGVTILSGLLYRAWSLEGVQIHSRPVSEFIPSMNIGLVWHEGKEREPLVKLFTEFMKSTLHSK